jgi:hypothetical protein
MYAVDIIDRLRRASITCKMLSGLVLDSKTGKTVSLYVILSARDSK